MTINLFNDVLAKVGVVMINPEGELFNPEKWCKKAICLTSA